MESGRQVFAEYEEVNFINYVNVLLKKRWLIIFGVFFCVLATGIYSKTRPPQYTASAKFLPSKNPEMTSRMGTLIGTSGRVETIENNVTSAYYTELLKSSPFLERIVQQKFLIKKKGEEINLISYYGNEIEKGTDSLSRVINTVAQQLEISTHRTTKVVTISYSTEESELSAAIVNAILEELIKYNQDMKDNKARLNREFIENQLEENRKLLKEAEAALIDFTAKNKKIATPDLEVELDRLKRNVKVQEEVFITLKKQLELAKIEEQEKTPVIQIIEQASVPLHKSNPKTKRNVMLAGFVSLFFFIGLAFVLDYVSKLTLDKERYKELLENLNAIKNDFRFLTRIFSRRKKDP
jgi:uncharacterized protein involved in exopolysaccharide biosynthesis